MPAGLHTPPTLPGYVYSKPGYVYSKPGYVYSKPGYVIFENPEHITALLLVGVTKDKKRQQDG